LEDAEVSETVRKSMEKQGMDFYTGARLKELRRGKKSVATVIEKDGKDLEIIVDRVISAVGVSPNVEGIGLEDVGINLDKNGFIAVDEYFRTSIEGIYAIGDVCGGPCLAHKASREGIICVEKIAAKTGVSPLDKSKIPGCIYCNPQVARVGLTEMQARDRGHEIKVGRFPFAGNGKAIALGEPQGLVKTIFDAQTGELLGAHMVGHEVTEMIHGFGLARDLEATEEELMHTVFPHPTLSEMMQESVLNAFGRTLHF
jgi:dihydrolipoamide dehydrogenase